MRVNLLELLGAEIGYVGELVFAKVFPDAARGDHVAMLVEAMYSANKLTPRLRRLPREEAPGVYSRHVTTLWPIHKSWFVPAVVDQTPRLLINPPKGTVKFLGKDEDGAYAYLLSLGLSELSGFVFGGVEPSLVDGYEVFNTWERQIALELYTKIKGVDRDALVEIVNVLKDVDFFIWDGGVVYHVEVKTTTRPTDAKLRKKRELLLKRQRVLEKLGVKPVLAVVVPRENWEVEIYLEKI